jgi:hypothetical protein
MLAGNGITRTSDAAPALASLLSNLTALRILDISGAFSPFMFKNSLHPHPDNNIVGFSSDKYDTWRPYDEVAAAFQPFALSLARLRDLESLNISGVRASAVNNIDVCFSVKNIDGCSSLVCYSCASQSVFPISPSPLPLSLNVHPAAPAAASPALALSTA